MNERTMRIRGGERVTVRPMVEADVEALVATYTQLSPASLRNRFFSPAPRLAPSVAADLALVDDDHLVLVAFDHDGALVAEARATRRADDPTVAEVAVTVADSHQRRGLGAKLVRLLRTHAKAAGIERLAGHIRSENVAAHALLVRSHAVSWFAEPGVIGFEIPLGRRTVAPEIAVRRTLGLAS
jgi:acetyltransferase